MLSGDLSEQRQELTVRLADLRTQLAPDSADALLEAIGALEVAGEELRVAEEEMAAQRAQIDMLVAGHQAELAWSERLTGAAPLALLQTRRDGTITTANPAAVSLLTRGTDELVGKPIVVLFEVTDQRVLRDAVSKLRRDHRQVEIAGTLRHAYGGLPVTVVGSSEIDARTPASLQWVLLPAPDGAPEHERPSRTEGASLKALAEMCVVPVGASDRQEMLHRLAQLTQQAVPHASAVSITLGSPLEPEQLSGDRTLALEVDAAQLAAGEGPCVDAFTSRELVVSTDLAADQRWPRLSARLRDLPVAGAVAVPVAAQDTCLGVLNAYVERPRHVDSWDVELARLAGRSVSAVLRTATDRRALTELSQNLERALSSRAVIDQAKGIVMARHHCTADEAFVRLSTISQRSNVKLREVARMLVEGAVSTDD